MEIVRRVHARRMVEWGRIHPKALVLSGDLTTSCEIDGFRDAFPDRFFSMGLMEQNMLGFAAGLAREGFVPMVHTFAVFMYRRALDQIEMSIAYANLPVRIFGFLPGVTTPGGATHQAINDLSVMRSLPNMTVVEMGDASEMEGLLDAIDPIPGPVYVRMIRGEIPRLFSQASPFRIGHARVLSQGDDIALFTTGICTEEALRAVHRLRAIGLGVSHLHISTLKPFEDQAVLEALSRARLGAIAMENHTIIGGLGTALAEMIADNGLGTRLIRLGLKDCYLQGASRPYLMARYGIDCRALVRAVEALAGKPLPVSDSDMAEIRLSDFSADRQQEAL